MYYIGLREIKENLFGYVLILRKIDMNNLNFHSSSFNSLAFRLIGISNLGGTILYWSRGIGD